MNNKFMKKKKIILRSIRIAYRLLTLHIVLWHLCFICFSYIIFTVILSIIISFQWCQTSLSILSQLNYIDKYLWKWSIYITYTCKCFFYPIYVLIFFIVSLSYNVAYKIEKNKINFYSLLHIFVVCYFVLFLVMFFFSDYYLSMWDLIHLDLRGLCVYRMYYLHFFCKLPSFIFCRHCNVIR